MAVIQFFDYLHAYVLDFCQVQVSLSGDDSTFDYQCYKLPRVKRRLTFCAQTVNRLCSTEVPLA